MQPGGERGGASRWRGGRIRRVPGSPALQPSRGSRNGAGSRPLPREGLFLEARGLPAPPGEARACKACSCPSTAGGTAGTPRHQKRKERRGKKESRPPGCNGEMLPIVGGPGGGGGAARGCCAPQRGRIDTCGCSKRSVCARGGRANRRAGAAPGACTGPSREAKGTCFCCCFRGFSPPPLPPVKKNKKTRRGAELASPTVQKSRGFPPFSLEGALPPSAPGISS